MHDHVDCLRMCARHGYLALAQVIKALDIICTKRHEGDDALGRIPIKDSCATESAESSSCQECLSH